MKKRQVNDFSDLEGQIVDQRDQRGVVMKALDALLGRHQEPVSQPKISDEAVVDFVRESLGAKPAQAQDLHGNKYNLVLPTILDVLQGRHKEIPGLPRVVVSKSPPADMKF